MYDGPYTILYAVDGKIQNCGPFATIQLATHWLKANSYSQTNPEAEIDFQTTVYLLYPDHTMVEFTKFE